MATTTATAMQEWARKYFRDRDEVYSDIYENRQFNAIYLTMLVMAGLIALLGLLINSPAVIIGAMLISPLMGPILSCGLAMTLADWDLGRKGLRNVGLSIVEVLIITALVTALSPLKDATGEILARSNPNLMDLLIAFFSGVAGSIALTTRSKTGLTIIPGVAIATAVMPPLATTGYGLATAQWQIARGSFMLFFTNLVAIIVSADLVFFIAGFRPSRVGIQNASPKFIRARGVIAFVILAVLSIPLVRTLAQAAQQARVRRQIQAVLKSLEKPHQVQLGNWHFESEPGKVVVDASVITAEPLDQKVVDQTERVLSATLSRTAELHVSQIRAENDPASATRNFLSGGNLAVAAPPPKAAEEVISDYQKRIHELLSRLSKPVGFSDVKVEAVGVQRNGSVNVHFSAQCSSPAEADMIAIFASAMERELSRPVALRAELRMGATPLGFLKNSAKLNRSGTNELRRLTELARRGERVEHVEIHFPALSPWNDRRAKTIKSAFNLPSTTVLGPASENAETEATVILRQTFSVQSGEVRETTAE